jgi:AcrR family transcriptional regulator
LGPVVALNSIPRKNAGSKIQGRGGKSSSEAGQARPVRKRRLEPQARAEMILAKAVEFFARDGFSGSIRDLANFSGVSSGLILKYFGSKEKLLTKAFNEIFISRWDEKKLLLLSQKDIPLRERLKEFYIWFFQISDDYNWIRTGLYSGLNGTDLSKWHYEVQVKRIIEIVAAEIREERGKKGGPLTPADLEIAWHLHSTFIQSLIRDHVYKRPVWRNKREMVDLVVTVFFDGVCPQSANMKPAARPAAKRTLAG